MRYLFFHFLLLLCVETYAQHTINLPDTLYADIKCTYSLSFQENRTDANKKIESMDLFIGKQGSIYQSSAVAILDSLARTATTPSQKMTVLKQAPRRSIPYEIIKSTDGYIVEKVNRDYYIDHKDSLQWTIGNEQQERHGLPCQQATTTFRGRTYTAWFTYNVPVSEGPYKFCGLPGLIVDIADTEGHYTFSLSSISKLENPKAIAHKLQKARAYTRNEYLKMQHRRGLDPVGAIAEQLPKGTSVPLREEQIRSMVEQYLRQNNPIERDIMFQ